MITFSTFAPTRIHVGPGKTNEIGAIARTYGSKAMVVTGRNSMRTSGYTDRIVNALRESGVQSLVFDQVGSNPERGMVNAAAGEAARFGADVVVGLGGGSALDTAKAVAVVARMGGDVWDYVSGTEVSRDVLPVIAAPSTAGTGSEVTPYTVISDTALKRKDGFMSDWIIPKVAIIDPELMSTAPPKLTASAGGDALAQAVEAYTTKLAHAYSDMLALESIRLCARYLRRAFRDGNDLEARAAMGWASALAGLAIAFVDVVIGHHASEAVGAIYHTHHGETAAALLVPTLEFNFDQTVERLGSIAQAMGRDTNAMDESSAAQAGVDSVRALLEEVEIPTRLASLGVKADAILMFTEILEERAEDLEAGNPREITPQTLQEFFERAI